MTTTHALSLHGMPKYGPEFAHVDYVNADALKGGNINLAVVGTFDSLNPFILKGLAAGGTNYLYQTLLEKSLDEPMTSYGLLAESVTMPQDRSWVTFTLRPQARWQDGKPVTADDVVWSFNTLLRDGQPGYRSYYAAVKDVQAIDATHVRFNFKVADNRELPLIIGDLPILPKHYWTTGGRDFSKTTLTLPIGSGAYQIKSVDNGRRIVLAHVKNWWAADLPINKGRFNFDTVTMDYYRDPSVAFQAFLAGAADVRVEDMAKNWAQGYDHPAVKKGDIKKEDIENSLSTGLQGFAFNTRRPIFQNARVREALDQAFDFEWSNKQLAFGAYKRCTSFFSNSDLAATMPISDAEKVLLEPFKDQLPPRVFTDVYHPARTNGQGDMRRNLRTALRLLAEAGWQQQNGVLKNKDGQPFVFDILVYSETFDRWLLPFIGNLKKLGIDAHIRRVDMAQYQNMTNDFDFDMVIESIPQSLTPGNEQAGYWGSASADVKGSQNLIGIKNPVIDALLPHITQAKTRDELVTATRALDRVLQWNYYVIPQWYNDTFRVAYWNRVVRPPVNPPYGLPYVETWWTQPGVVQK